MRDQILDALSLPEGLPEEETPVCPLTVGWG